MDKHFRTATAFCPSSPPLEELHASKLNGSYPPPLPNGVTLDCSSDENTQEGPVTQNHDGIDERSVPSSAKVWTAVAEELYDGRHRNRGAGLLGEFQTCAPFPALSTTSAVRLEQRASSMGSIDAQTITKSTDASTKRHHIISREGDDNNSSSKRKRVLSPAGEEGCEENGTYFTPVNLHHRNGNGSLVRRNSTPKSRRVSRAASTSRISSARDASERVDQYPKPVVSSSKAGHEFDTNHRNVAELSSLEPQVSVSSRHLPLPPLSMPTFLQLELSANRPSPLYIHSSSTVEYPYESSRVKFERLINFLSLPPHLEQTLLFGTLACLDAWLYIITILPLRFLKASFNYIEWLAKFSLAEALGLTNFMYQGTGRFWLRYRKRRLNVPADSQNKHASTKSPEPRSIEKTLSSKAFAGAAGEAREANNNLAQGGETFPQNQIESQSPHFQSNHKADLLQGLLIITCSTILMRFDASRMYHAVKGQSAIKLYVIYNGLEVCDRLFSALGQDVMECLFSRDTLDRNPRGRSKLLRQGGMFFLGLAYSVIHSTALLYQVVTLNVAVNSYSNALLTLLISNQFVEIKGSVFKRIEKENLFQLTCADVVERFQLWIMLLIIALRNIVEMGGFKISFGAASASVEMGNTTASNTSYLTSKLAGIFPHGFSIWPSFPLQVFVPFLIVIGSEMLVDWLKHAYINKFNAISPKIYGRFLDVLAKDYYSNAFTEQNLTKRLGLPVIPLSCLFIRSTMQTYHMFLAQNVPPSITSATMNLSESEASTPASTAVLAHLDHIIRDALGRSTFGGASSTIDSAWYQWSIDDVIAFSTMIVFFLVVYLLLLAFKLALGISLLSFARSRYKGMRKREQQKVVEPNSKRRGQWAVVEMDEDKRKWIYEEDPGGLAKIRARQTKAKASAAEAVDRLDHVDRYSMVAKRIW